MLYFAYGSNLDPARMNGRCPTAKFVCRAALPNHRLCFPRAGGMPAHGVAGIAVCCSSSTWGVIYEVPEFDMKSLDKAEGYHPERMPEDNSYNREPCQVLQEGDHARPIAAQAYFAVAQPNPPLPSATYMCHIIEGARYWHLPDEYIAELEAIEVQE